MELVFMSYGWGILGNSVSNWSYEGTSYSPSFGSGLYSSSYSSGNKKVYNSDSIFEAYNYSGNEAYYAARTNDYRDYISGHETHHTVPANKNSNAASSASQTTTPETPATKEFDSPAYNAAIHGLNNYNRGVDKKEDYNKFLKAVLTGDNSSLTYVDSFDWTNIQNMTPNEKIAFLSEAQKTHPDWVADFLKNKDNAMLINDELNKLVSSSDSTAEDITSFINQMNELVRHQSIGAESFIVYIEDKCGLSADQKAQFADSIEHALDKINNIDQYLAFSDALTYNGTKVDRFLQYINHYEDNYTNNNNEKYSHIINKDQFILKGLSLLPEPTESSYYFDEGSDPTFIISGIRRSDIYRANSNYANIGELMQRLQNDDSYDAKNSLLILKLYQQGHDGKDMGVGRDYYAYYNYFILWLRDYSAKTKDTD